MGRALRGSGQTGRVGRNGWQHLGGSADRRYGQGDVRDGGLIDARPLIGHCQYLSTTLLEEVHLDWVKPGRQGTGPAILLRSMQPVVVDQQRAIEQKVAAVVAVGIEGISADRWNV